MANGNPITPTVGLTLALVVQAAAVVWWASGMESEIRHNDFKIQMLNVSVEENSQFVKLWPAGKWGSGSLPDDVRQNLKISRLEAEVMKLNEVILRPISETKTGRD